MRTTGSRQAPDKRGLTGGGRVARRVVVAAVAVLVGLVGSTFSPGGVGARSVGDRAHLPSPVQALKKAKLILPYQPAIPAGIPESLTMDLADYGDPGEGSPTLDLWYSDGSGKVALHIWQTSLPPEALGPHDDPTRQGTPELIDGKEWMVLRMDRGSWADLVLSRRLDSGLLVSMDAIEGTEAAGALRQMAAELD